MIVVAIARLRSAPKLGRAIFAVVQLPAILDLRQSRFYILKFGRVDLVGLPCRQKLLYLFLRFFDPVGSRRMGLKCFRERAWLLFFLCLNLLEKCGEGLRVVAALVHVLHA